MTFLEVFKTYLGFRSLINDLNPTSPSLKLSVGREVVGQCPPYNNSTSVIG